MGTSMYVCVCNIYCVYEYGWHMYCIYVGHSIPTRTYNNVSVLKEVILRDNVIRNDVSNRLAFHVFSSAISARERLKEWTISYSDFKFGECIRKGRDRALYR